MFKKKLILTFVFILTNFNLNKYQNNLIVYGHEVVKPRKAFHHQRKFTNLRPLHHRNLPPKAKSFVNIWENNPRIRQQNPLEKRFLSSETKKSMKGVSVASNSVIHDNYISQQFKWSNRFDTKEISFFLLQITMCGKGTNKMKVLCI